MLLILCSFSLWLLWTDKPLLQILPLSIEVALCLQSVAVVDRQASFTDTSTFTGTSTRISSMVMALWLQSINVHVDRQATYTDTSTRIISMEVALCLQSVNVVDRQAAFTGTSTRISSMVMALWLQSVPM